MATFHGKDIAVRKGWIPGLEGGRRTKGGEETNRPAPRPDKEKKGKKRGKGELIIWYTLTKYRKVYVQRGFRNTAPLSRAPPEERKGGGEERKGNMSGASYLPRAGGKKRKGEKEKKNIASSTVA